MEFHETVRGARFYDGQVPQLVNNLERIAVALETIVENLGAEVEDDSILDQVDSVTRPPFPNMRDDSRQET
tara:strand:- start:1229 stop:1441 length:213 start_codon:yes stop_codon:yes gene_type:complete